MEKYGDAAGIRRARERAIEAMPTFPRGNADTTACGKAVAEMVE